MITFGRGRSGGGDRTDASPLLSMIDHVPMIVFTADAKGLIRFATAGYYDFIGTHDIDLAGGGWLEPIHDDDRAALEQTWKTAVASGQPWRAEPRVRRADGMYRWHRVMAHPVRDPDGEVTAWIGSATDVHDLRSSDAEARNRSARLQAILDLEPECVKLVAPGGTLLEMNPAGLEMVQVDDASAVIGQRVIDLVHPDDQAAFEQLHRRVSAGRGPGSLEFRIVGRRGRTRWVESTSVGVEIPVGSSPLSVLSVTRDVTDRRRAEAFLRAESRMLNQLTSGADLPTLLHAVTEALDEAFGATSSVLLVDPDGRHLRHGAGPGLPQRFLDHIDGGEVGPRAGSCGTAVHRGERVIVSDIATDPLWADYREVALSCGLRACWATPVRDGHGNVVASLAEYHSEPYEPDPLELQLSDRAATLLGLAIDRIRSDEAVQRSNAMFSMASDLARLGWWSIDVESMEMAWSDVAREIHGVPPGHTPALEEAVLLYAPEEREVLRKAVTECATNGTPYSLELRVLHPDGEDRWVRGDGRAVTDADGRVVAIEGSSQDLTEQHRAEAAMRSMEAQLSQAQRLEAVGQLTGGVAHDFNNLLTVILGNADLLADAIHDDELRSLVEATRAAAARGAELTQRMLAFARRQPLHPTAVDVGALLVGLEGMLARTLGAEVRLAVELEPDLPRVLVDPAQLEAAILNLCLNARDAMPGGGDLRVEATSVASDVLERAVGSTPQPARALATDAQPDAPCDRWVRIAVADSGTGMPPEVLERAFDPFFTTKEVGKGTGLGLSMVYGFIQQSAGQVRVHSTPGQGATVELYLPCTDVEAPPPQEGPNRPRDALRGGAERILLVEDDELVRDHVAHQLHRLGYQVEEAADAERALELLASGTAFDLLFTDIVMPGGTDGRQLAELARAQRPGLRVLFSSGYAAQSLIEGGRLDDGAHLLTKPYTPGDLARVVREVLDEPTPTA